MMRAALLTLVLALLFSHAASAVSITSFRLAYPGPYSPNSTLLAVLEVSDTDAEYLLNYYIEDTRGRQITENYSMVSNASRADMKLEVPDVASGNYYITAMVIRGDDVSIDSKGFLVVSQDEREETSMVLVYVLLVIAAAGAVAALYFVFRKKKGGWE